jgi:phosphatidylserine/phosphatidylglycerophosphate/cardiolipin synthase-like enzyme
MADRYTKLMPLIHRLSDELPGGILDSLAQALATCPTHDWSLIRLRAFQYLPQPQQRALAETLLREWQQHARDIPPTEVALLIRAAAATTRHLRSQQQIELVWTGPLVRQIDMRRTDQALLQVVHMATNSLLIVSFAVYRISAITAALVQAAERGVVIRICVEAPEPSGQRMANDTIRALGPEVAQRAAMYVWPQAARARDTQGRSGVLHAKCAVADHQHLFLSSANLTDNAMSLNMELGVLISGGPIPGTVAAQFDGMIASGILREVTDTPSE